VITISHTISMDSTLYSNSSTPRSALAGVLSVDIDYYLFFTLLILKIGPASSYNCFQQITKQQLQVPGEKTMCFIINSAAKVVVAPQYFSHNDDFFSTVHFFGNAEHGLPIMMQALIDDQIFVTEDVELKAYGVRRRQWALKEETFQHCHGTAQMNQAERLNNKVCHGSLKADEVNGDWKAYLIPDTNLVAIYITEYQKFADVSYCGLLSSGCPDVAEDSNLPVSKPNQCFSSKTWYTERQRSNLNMTCPHMTNWQQFPETLDMARGGQQCPEDDNLPFILSVLVPVAVIVLALCLTTRYRRYVESYRVGVRVGWFRPPNDVIAQLEKAEERQRREHETAAKSIKAEKEAEGKKARFEALAEEEEANGPVSRVTK